MADAPDPYLLQRLDGFQDSIVRLDQKIDDKLGDHSTRIAKLEVRSDNNELTVQRILHILESSGQRTTEARRWVVATFIAAMAAVAGITAAVVELVR
jgi:hypothetical protein